MTYVASLRIAPVQNAVMSAKKRRAQPLRAVRLMVERLVFNAIHQRRGYLLVRSAYVVRRNYHRPEGDSRRSQPIANVMAADTTCEPRLLVRHVLSVGNLP
jgi:hypothetical protein